MKRGNYVTPYTRRICVCTEGTFASSATGTAIENGEITTTGHQLNEINGFDSNNNAAEWNDGAWE